MAEKKRTKRGNGEGAVYPATKKKVVDGQVIETKYYRGYVTLDIVGGAQKRKYVSGATRTQCSAEVRKLLNARDAGTLKHSKSVTTQEWVDHYLTEVAPKKPIKGRTGNAANTIASYKGLAKNWVFPRVGKKPVEKLTAEDLEAVYKAMAAAGLATSSIRSCHALMRVALEHAWKRDRAPRNVAKLAILPAGAQPDPTREVPVEEMQAILVRANARRMAERWVVRLAYGTRQGECLGLRWPDVDFDKEVIWIRQQLQRDRAEHGCGDPVGTEKTRQIAQHGCGDPVGVATTRTQSKGHTVITPLQKPKDLYPCGKRKAAECPKTTGTVGDKDRDVYPCGQRQPIRCPQHKGGGLVLVPVKTRASQAPLPMPKPIADLLRKRKSEQKRERIQEGPRWVGWEWQGEQADLVFTQPNGRPIGAHDDWEEWYELLDEAGVDPINPHAARAAMATLLVSLGVDPRVVMEMLRHANISTSMDLYAKAPSKAMRAAAEALTTALLGKAAGD